MSDTGPILGTTFVEFAGDTSKLDASLSKVEQKAKTAGTSVEKSLNTGLKNGIGGIDSGFALLEKNLDKFTKRIIETGNSGPRALRPVIGAQQELRRAIEDSYGSLNKATPKIQQQYAAMGQAISAATRHQRELNVEWRVQQQLISPAGAPHTLAEAAEGGLAQAGFANASMLLPKAIGYALIAEQELRLIGAIGTAIGSEWKQWADIAMHSISTVGKEYNRRFGQTGMLQFLQEGFGLFGGAKASAQFDADTAALAGAKYGDGSFNPSNIDDVKQQLTQDIAIKQLQLKNAEINNQTSSAKKLAAELANLELTQSVLNGDTYAYAKAIQDATKKNEDDTDAVKKRAEAEAELDRIFSQSLPKADKWNHVAKDILTPYETIAAQDLQFAQNLGPGVQKVLDVTLLAPVTGTLGKVAFEYAKNAMLLADVYKKALGSVETLFVDVFDAAITGKLNKLDDAFKNFLRSVTAEIERMMAQKAVMALLGFAQSRWPGMFSTGSYASGANTFTGGFGGPPSTGYAMGGVLSGGFRAFAGGGVITQPTLGLVGEGKYNEAVVPLPDNKSIPVKMIGGGRGEKHEVLISLDHGLLVAAGSAAVAQAHSDVIINIRQGGDIYREINRMIKAS